MHAAHDFGQRRVFEIRQAVAVLAFGQEQVPQPCGLGLVLQLFEDGRNLPAVRPGGELLLERPFVGIYVVVHEPADLGPQVFHLRRKIEIHHGRSFLGSCVWDARVGPVNGRGNAGAADGAA